MPSLKSARPRNAELVVPGTELVTHVAPPSEDTAMAGLAQLASAVVAARRKPPGDTATLMNRVPEVVASLCVHVLPPSALTKRAEGADPSPTPAAMTAPSAETAGCHHVRGTSVRRAVHDAPMSFEM